MFSRARDELGRPQFVGGQAVKVFPHWGNPPAQEDVSSFGRIYLAALRRREIADLVESRQEDLH